MSKIHSLRFLEPSKTAFFLCDIQDKFRKAIPLFEPMIQNVSRLLEAGKAFQVPLFVTEQYPEKLGNTVKELDICHASATEAKTVFSMLPALECALKEVYGGAGTPRDVVLFGIESHVCVEQTAMDLLERKINVFLVADCVASRLNQDRDLALERLRHSGCIIATSESVIYNFIRDKNHPKFNDLRKSLVALSADMQIAPTNSKL